MSSPLCRQFWKAGNYDDRLASEPTRQSDTSCLRIHPKFLHSNATSHKWVFGAFAELLDNAVDEIKNGATFVIVDKTTNHRDRTPTLVIQDDGGGMDPESMRRCLSFGFSDKNSKTTIGQYGNGFKTSTMRLGADVVVLSRCEKGRKLTQSVGLLSYTFLMQTRQDRIVVPMVDYQFDLQTGFWNILYDEDQFKNNLAILLQWSPFTTEAELLKHCDDIGGHGTKIMIYNLWHSDEGEMELDFESDLEASVITAIGFLKEAPLVNIHGFNVYHKNRLILPFWHVASYHKSRGRGVVGVLEANFIQPIHSKQDFEKTPVFQKLEFRLKQMAQEYWDHHCGHIGYHQIKKRPQATVTPHTSSDLRPSGIYQPVLLGTKPSVATGPKLSAATGTIPHETNPSLKIMAAKSGVSVQSFHQNSRGVPLKRKELDHDVEPERVTRTGVIGSKTNDTMLGVVVQYVPTPTQLENQMAANPIFENRRLHTLCQEYEKIVEALNRKVEFLRMELDEAQHKYAHLLLESDSMENAKWENEVIEIED